MYCYVEPRTDPDDHAMLDGRLRTSVSITGRGVHCASIKDVPRGADKSDKAAETRAATHQRFRATVANLCRPASNVSLLMHPIISTSVADMAVSGSILEFNFLRELAQSS